MREAGQNNGRQGHATHHCARDGVAHVVGILAKPTGHIAALDQAVKMQAVGHAGVVFADFAAEDAEQHFGHWVHTNCEGGKG